MSARTRLGRGHQRTEALGGRASPSTHLAWAGVCAGFEDLQCEVDAVTSRNKEFVSNLQKAVEQAFVVRARQPPVSEPGGSQGGSPRAEEVRSRAITPSAGTPNVGN
jgi:hypothetical protein